VRHPERVERLALRAPVARRHCGGERLLSVLQRVTKAPAKEPRAREPRQQRSPFAACIAGGQHRESALRGVEPLRAAVQRPPNPRQARQQARVTARIGARIQLMQGALEEHFRARSVPRDPVGGGGQRDQLDMIKRKHRLGVRHPRPQLERPLREVCRLAVGMNVASGHGRPNGCPQCSRLIAGRRVVARDCGGELHLPVVTVGHPRLERARKLEMKLPSLSGQQVVVQGLAQQRVSKEQAVVLAGHEHLLGDRFAKRRVECLALDPGYPRDRRLVEAAADGDRPGGSLGILRETLDPQDEGVAEALRGRAAPIEPRRKQLLGVERVTLASPEQPLHKLPVRSVAEDVGKDLGDLRAIEGRQIDAPGALQTLELAQQGTQRVAAVQLVGSIAQQEHHALLTKAPGEESDEATRRAIRPVHVLEDQNERLTLAQQIEQLEQRLEQPQLGRGVVLLAGRPCLVEPWKERGELSATGASELSERRMALAHQRPQRAEDGSVRQLPVGRLDRLAAQDERDACLDKGARARDAMLKLSDQPALADARLTAQQHHHRAPGGRLLQGQLELGELPDSPDEVAAGQPGSHA
jgi:hypothetical protein